MGKVISFYNQKGGVGKTTTVINLAAALAETGFFRKNILVVDMDPQGNTTSGFGIDKTSLDANVYTVLLGKTAIEESLLPLSHKRLFILPATSDLTGFEVESLQLEGATSRLKMALDKIKEDYDFIFIDCPPSLGMLSLNALCASDSVLIPIQTEFYALEGVSQLRQTLDMVRQQVNPKLEVEGVLLTMVDSRTNLANDVAAEVNKYFEEDVYETVIPRNIRLAEAPSYGESIISYDKKSKGGQAYMALAKEFKKRDKKRS